MSEKISKPQSPDIMEAIFDCGYLLFDLIAGFFLYFQKEIRYLYFMEF